MSLDLSKKQKKELKKLQQSAAHVWEAQQVVAASAAELAKQAGRQLETFGRQQVAPTVEEKYHEHVGPYVDRARPYVDRSMSASKKFVQLSLLPVTGTVAGKALSAWDASAGTRAKLAHLGSAPVPPPKKKSSAGPVIAFILGIGAAVGVLYAAWQTLRADDELWVADDPLAAPDA
ncbi:DNA helicase [Microbacterium oryzae]|uniref:DNA helicase n=1 Tax=Microbacterium oryzae TaxID=743009 RepID=UPI0025AEF2E5|nr:DNA helicase [Microbacterium oryzae]MDN3311953.1 DNA helicase [Microbacterium oryzae]